MEQEVNSVDDYEMNGLETFGTDGETERQAPNPASRNGAKEGAESERPTSVWLAEVSHLTPQHPLSRASSSESMRSIAHNERLLLAEIWTTSNGANPMAVPRTLARKPNAHPSESPGIAATRLDVEFSQIRGEFVDTEQSLWSPQSNQLPNAETLPTFQRHNLIFQNPATSTKVAGPHAFERWEELARRWESTVTVVLNNLEADSTEMEVNPLLVQLSVQANDLVAADSNLFYAMVELQGQGVPLNDYNFQRWETLSLCWEGITSFWIRRLQAVLEDIPLRSSAQLSRLVTDLSATGTSLFHAVVGLQRLRASSIRENPHSTRTMQGRSQDASKDSQKQMQNMASRRLNEELQAQRKAADDRAGRFEAELQTQRAASDEKLRSLDAELQAERRMRKAVMQIFTTDPDGIIGKRETSNPIIHS